jgi:hypothetical protein
MKLEKKLAAWREANLLAPEQERAILAFERARNRPANWIVLALGAVGALGIVTGVISLISSNWDSIPAAVKLAAALALVVAALAAAYGLSTEGRTLASDLLLAAHSGLVLAMIGLVGQVYHLSGAPWRALALAAAMALPVALISERSILSDIVIGYALVALGLFLGDSRALHPYLDGFGWVLAGAAIGGALLLLADGLQRVHPGATGALRRWGGALVFAGAVAAATVWTNGWSGSTRPHLMAVCSAVAVAWLLRLAWARKGALAVGAVALSGLVVGAAWIGGRFPSMGWHDLDAPTRFAGFALFCAAGAAFAVAAANAGSRRLTNLFTLAIAARIVVLFLEVLRTLALTGFGLLLAGAVFCGVAWGWWRLHALLPVKEAGP